MFVDFKPDFNKGATAYTDPVVAANVKDYKVAPDLSNVENTDQFANLNADQTAALVQNGFVVSPTTQEQLFYIYEDNAYKKVPSFISSDTVLQLYHIFFDFTLRNLEMSEFFDEAKKLNNNLLSQLILEYSSVTDPTVKAQAQKAVAYFGVAQLAFGETLPDNFPSEIKDVVTQEKALIDSAAGRSESPLMGSEIDYSLFTVRGHYTRTVELGDYFKGMSWYGVVPFPLYDNDGTRDTNSTVMAIISTIALCNLNADDGAKLWENIYSPTCFFVGSSDDVTPYEYAQIIKDVYGDKPDLNTVGAPAKLDAFYNETDALPAPQIVSKAAADSKSKQFRFMGQRYIPDSEVLQNLSDSKLRPIPSGLDVMAVFGSTRAENILADVYKPAQQWPGYTDAFRTMKNKFDNLPDSTWQSNMYYGWLFTLKSLLGTFGNGYPSFMKNTAWQDKSLSTALGSWAELRHDTILYAKGSVAECGGGEETPVVKGYVEPNVALYSRLLWLVQFSETGLANRGLLPDDVKEKMDTFSKMLTFLQNCSVKELNNEELTAENYDDILTYGGWMEYMTAGFSDGYKWMQITSETDRNMANIADVHSANGNYLEEAVGNASEIYVVVPIGGKLYLTRGAAFDYYEFVSQQRLTDEAWQSMVKSAPKARPPWTDSFIRQGAEDVPVPADPYSTGC